MAMFAEIDPAYIYPNFPNSKFINEQRSKACQNSVIPFMFSPFVPPRSYVFIALYFVIHLPFFRVKRFSRPLHLLVPFLKKNVWAVR